MQQQLAGSPSDAPNLHKIEQADVITLIFNREVEPKEPTGTGQRARPLSGAAGWDLEDL